MYTQFRFTTKCLRFILLGFFFLSFLKTNCLSFKNFQIEHFTLREFSDNGTILREIKAKLATTDVQENAQIIYLREIEVFYFDKNGKAKVRLKADVGKIDFQTKNFSAIGKVQVFTSDGTQVYTDSLHWDEKKQKFFTDSEVSIIKNKHRLTGIGLEGDIYLTKVVIKNKAKVTGG